MPSAGGGPILGDMLLTFPTSSLRVRRAASRGVTLIELMVTISVLAILAAIATPSMQALILSQRMITTSNDFIMAIQRSRSEAMAKNQCVVLCLSSTVNSAGVKPQCDTVGSNWAVGWVAYQLPSCESDNRPTSASEANSMAEQRLFEHEALTSSMRISSANDTRAIVFSPRGFLASSNPGKFNLKDMNASSTQNDHYGRTICLDKVGRARSITLDANCS